MSQHLLNSIIRRNPVLTWMLFGIRPNDTGRIHWDFTTLVLRRALRESVRPGMHVLEIGTGPYALLPLSIAPRIDCRIDACDINPAYAAHAQNQIPKTVAGIRIFTSDLFTSVERRYDLIFSNTLYIPRDEGRRRGINRMHEKETDWCGGDSGYEFIGRFLEEGTQYLSPGGMILLGFNTVYLEKEIVEQHCRHNGYSITAVTQQLLNPSRVYHLRVEHPDVDGSQESATMTSGEKRYE
ncbi:MAG: hypothetical protein JXA28_09135 [Bacteroidetes bacterium]|nr:hypothetical protein [Bacteroidota bacterium]